MRIHAPGFTHADSSSQCQMVCGRCDADVWARNAELELLTQISLADFFDACRCAPVTVQLLQDLADATLDERTCNTTPHSFAPVAFELIKCPFVRVLSAENYTVGEEAISYYQDGEGPCAGMPAAAAKEVRASAPCAFNFSARAHGRLLQNHRQAGVAP